MVLRKVLTVGASAAAVWTAWTTTDGARSFFCPGWPISAWPSVGGMKYTLSRVHRPGNAVRKGAGVLGWLPQEMLAL